MKPLVIKVEFQNRSYNILYSIDYKTEIIHVLLNYLETKTHSLRTFRHHL